ncbi:phage protein Gp36 family protein [uncultured Desulfovibrio sp.]|uniref:phage protein Gp36 family protein n=1 Tax=uncultured Desulfovibrio sp. TaxID=167968 RepID=UPI00262894C6|nr:phage protein Gp36 family protein [uncultured Desulfovibrio sp.]
MLLCRRDHIVDLLHADYVAACEEQNPGLVERTIEAVSGEVADALSYRYPQPWPYVPELIRYIAAVISAYRVVEAITSLVDTEASSANEWLPLQKQWKYVTGLLEDIVSGKQKLPLEETNPDREEASVAVVSRPPLFNLRGL